MSINNKTNGAGKGIIRIHETGIEFTQNGQANSQNASTAFTDGSSLVYKDASIAISSPANGGWVSIGRYNVYLGNNTLPSSGVVTASPFKVEGSGPELQFKLDVLQTDAVAKGLDNHPIEQQVNLQDTVKANFNNPAYLEINLDGFVDLKNVPGGWEPYVATYDGH